MSANKAQSPATRARIPLAALLLGLGVALALIHAADAKRGCMAFGHSCFGGHGKRADLEPGMPETEEAAEAEAEAEAAALLGEVAGPPHRFRLSPFLRQWLQRAYQQPPADTQTIEVK